jgi:transcriptional regulator with XRE-family HTH domain
MEFAERLVAQRKQQGLTQQALADRAELHVSQIRRYEPPWVSRRRFWLVSNFHLAGGVSTLLSQGRVAELVESLVLGWR